MASCFSGAVAGAATPFTWHQADAHPLPAVRGGKSAEESTPVCVQSHRPHGQWDIPLPVRQQARQEVVLLHRHLENSVPGDFPDERKGAGRSDIIDTGNGQPFSSSTIARGALCEPPGQPARYLFAEHRNLHGTGQGPGCRQPSPAGGTGSGHPSTPEGSTVTTPQAPRYGHLVDQLGID